MKTLFLSLMLLSSFTLKALPSEWSMNKDAKGDIYYRQTFISDRYSKEALYRHAKAWMLGNLNASENWIYYNEADHDSLKTMAFVLLGNGLSLRNQFVSMVVAAYFNDQKVEVRATGIYYHGTRNDTGELLDVPVGSLLNGIDPEMKAAWTGFDKQMQTLNRSLLLALR